MRRAAADVHILQPAMSERHDDCKYNVLYDIVTKYQYYCSTSGSPMQYVDTAVEAKYS